MGSIDVKSAIELCRAYGGTLEEFENVLLLEEIIFPRIVARVKAAAEAAAAASKRNKPTIH